MARFRWKGQAHAWCARRAGSAWGIIPRRVSYARLDIFRPLLGVRAVASARPVSTRWKGAQPAVVALPGISRPNPAFPAVNCAVEGISRWDWPAHAAFVLEGPFLGIVRARAWSAGWARTRRTGPGAAWIARLGLMRVSAGPALAWNARWARLHLAVGPVPAWSARWACFCWLMVKPAVKSVRLAHTFRTISVFPVHVGRSALPQESKSVCPARLEPTRIKMAVWLVFSARPASIHPS